MAVSLNLSAKSKCSCGYSPTDEPLFLSKTSSHFPNNRLSRFLHWFLRRIVVVIIIIVIIIIIIIIFTIKHEYYAPRAVGGEGHHALLSSTRVELLDSCTETAFGQHLDFFLVNPVKRIGLPIALYTVHLPFAAVGLSCLDGVELEALLSSNLEGLLYKSLK